MNTGAFDQYKNQSLSTMSQGELLVKVFDELIKQCRLAELAMQRNEKGVEHESLIKAQTIISTLAASLDERFQISKELRDLYIFFAHELRDANLRKEVGRISAIMPLIKDLRNSFAQADRISRSDQNSATRQAPAIVGGRAI